MWRRRGPGWSTRCASSSDEGADGVLAVRAGRRRAVHLPEHPAAAPVGAARRGGRAHGAAAAAPRRLVLGLEVLRRADRSGAGTSTSSGHSSARDRRASTPTTSSSTWSSTPDGDPAWKDVEQLRRPARAGPVRRATTWRRVLAAAAEVTDLLDRDDRWWAPWDDWAPPRVVADVPTGSRACSGICARATGGRMARRDRPQRPRHPLRRRRPRRDLVARAQDRARAAAVDRGARGAARPRRRRARRRRRGLRGRRRQGRPRPRSPRASGSPGTT